MRLPALLSLLVVIAGCSSDESPFTGPVNMTIDPATNHQEARAAEDDSLSHSVDAILWRGRGSGASAQLRLVTPAYAQTAVDGAPVVGALVNAVPVGDCPLTPWNPAAQTDSDGFARFWFEPGTKAGTCMAEIRYTDGVSRFVTDTAIAEVAPGPPASHRYDMGFHVGFRGTEHQVQLPADYLIDEYGNNAYFRLVHVEGSFEIAGDGDGSPEARTVAVSTLLDQDDPDDRGYLGWAAVAAGETTLSYLRVAFDAAGLSLMPCATQTDPCQP